MDAESVRNELRDFVRRVPFEAFAITFDQGERVIVGYPENIAFDPRPETSSNFYVLTSSVRLFSRFEAVDHLEILSDTIVDFGADLDDEPIGYVVLPKLEKAVKVTFVPVGELRPMRVSECCENDTPD